MKANKVSLIKRLAMILVLVAGVSQSTIFADDWKMPWDQNNEYEETGRGSHQRPKVWDSKEKYNRNQDSEKKSKQEKHKKAKKAKPEKVKKIKKEKRHKKSKRNSENKD